MLHIAFNLATAMEISHSRAFSQAPNGPHPDLLLGGTLLLLLYVLPRSPNFPNRSSLKTRKLEVWHLAHSVRAGTDHRRMVGSECRSKERPTMLVLLIGVKLADS